MSVLTIRNLRKEIQGRELFYIDQLAIEKGEKIGLMGRNGSGKTTLLEAIVKGHPNIRIKGKIHYVPQLKDTGLNKSGGERTAHELDQAFRKRASLLLVDEPTNNLDRKHRDWVVKEFQKYPGAILFVSHDRHLLDQACDSIWELEDQTLKVYKGNYSAYRNQKAIERAEHERAYNHYQGQVERLTRAIQAKEDQAERAGKRPKKLSPSERRIKGAKTYYAGVQKNLHQSSKAMQSRLDQLEAVEKPKDRPSLWMKFPNEGDFVKKTIFRVEDLEGRVGKKLLWHPASFFIKGGDRIGIIGDNGAGKTTLIKKLMDPANPQVKQSPLVKIGYFSQDLDHLDDDLSILENVKAEAIQEETLIRTILAQLGFDEEEMKKKASVLSGGERVKIQLAKLLVGDFNTLILDEPTNHLDIYALEALEDMLLQFQGTILLISHDQHLLASVPEKILVMRDSHLDLFDGNYQEYVDSLKQTEDADTENQRLVIENRLTEVLNLLTFNPDDPELNEEFDKLIQRRRDLDL